MNKGGNRRIALRVGKEYFDGTREQGYDGYLYDGRWLPIAGGRQLLAVLRRLRCLVRQEP